MTQQESSTATGEEAAGFSTPGQKWSSPVDLGCGGTGAWRGGHIAEGLPLGEMGCGDSWLGPEWGVK